MSYKLSIEVSKDFHKVVSAVERDEPITQQEADALRAEALRNVNEVCSALPKETTASKPQVRTYATQPTTQASGDIPTCDACGATMVLRKGKNGDFYSCPNWSKDAPEHKAKKA